MASTPLENPAEAIAEPTDAAGRTTIRLSSIPAGPRVFRIVPGIDFFEEATLQGFPLDPALARFYFREAYTLRPPEAQARRAELTMRATPATSLRGTFRFNDSTQRPATGNFLVFSSTNPTDYEHNTVDEDAFFIPRLSATEPGVIAFFVPEARETPLLTLRGATLDRPEHDAGEFEFIAPEASVPLRYTHGPASMFNFDSVHMHDAVFYWNHASWIAEDGSFAYILQTEDQEGATVHWSSEDETMIAPGRYFVVPGNAAYGDELTAAVLARIAAGEQRRLRELGVPWAEVPDGHEGVFAFQIDPVEVAKRLIGSLID